MRDHFSIVSSHGTGRQKERNGRRNGKNFIFESSIVTSNPNHIRKMDNRYIKNQLILLEPRLVANIPNVIPTKNTSVNIQSGNQANPDFSNILTVEKQMLSRFFKATTKAALGGERKASLF